MALLNLICAKSILQPQDPKLTFLKSWDPILISKMSKFTDTVSLQTLFSSILCEWTVSDYQAGTEKISRSLTTVIFHLWEPSGVLFSRRNRELILFWNQYSTNTMVLHTFLNLKSKKECIINISILLSLSGHFEQYLSDLLDYSRIIWLAAVIVWPLHYLKYCFGIGVLCKNPGSWLLVACFLHPNKTSFCDTKTKFITTAKVW